MWEIIKLIHSPKGIIDIIVMLTVDAVLLFFALFVFILFDRSLANIHPMYGQITGKDYSPSSVHVISTGETTTTVLIPESWTLKVFVLDINKTLNCEVNKSSYDNATEGSRTNVSVSYGFFSGNPYCNKILNHETKLEYAK